MHTGWPLGLIVLCLLGTSRCADSRHAPTVSDLIPQEGLLAFYPLDGHAEDATTNAFHGLVSGAVPTFDRFGNPEGAYWFDGVDDHIDLGTVDALKPPFPLSIAMWVRVDQVGSSTAAFTNSFDVAINTGVWIAFSSDRGRAAINFGDGGPAGSMSIRNKRGESPLAEGRWYHIVGIARGDKDLSVFVDGVNDGGSYSGPASTLVYGVGPASLGRRYSGHLDPPVFFEGAIDELALYDRALTEKEVRQLYEAGSTVQKRR